MLSTWIKWDERLALGLRYPQDLLLLLLRLSLALVFFNSGLLKVQSWDSTLELFNYDYAVPLLPPTAAAWLGTVAELTLPILLSLGLLARLAALALFAFNAIAMWSYPDISPAGIKDHYLWGLGFVWLFFAGSGALSLDRLLAIRMQARSRFTT